MSEWDKFPEAPKADPGWDAFPAAPRSEPAASFDRNDPRFQDMSVSKAMEGIPILGAYAPHAAAALSTLAHPITGVGKGSYAANLADEKAASEAYEREHPYASAASKMVGGTVATAPLAALATAARLLGMSGTLGGMIRNAALSGTAIGGLDAAARGDNPTAGAVEGGLAGAVLPGAGRLIGMGARGVRNLVSPTPRVAPKVDLNGAEVPVPQSYIDPTNATGSHEQAALSGALNPENQEIAQAAQARTQAATQAAAENFGNELRGGPGPSQPAATKPAAAGQTITELAQAHNDQITAQARADATEAGHIAAEGASIRYDVGAPLGTPEPAVPRTAGDAIEGLRNAIQRRAENARTNVGNLYRVAGEQQGEYHPAAFSEVGQSIRNRVENPAVAQGVQRVTVNPQLTPHANAALDMLDNRLDRNYYENALSRGDMVRMPDGRVVPRPLSPADVESARQELVGHLRDARSAARAPGGSGTDAYAMQRIMQAFDTHHNAVLGTPGAFSGNGAALRASLDAARAAHSQRRATFSNQGGGDTVGPVVERIIGRHPGQDMPTGQMATALYGPANSPGGGNSLALAQRAMQIAPDQRNNFRQGLLSHILDNPEGMEAMEPGRQADRLSKYMQTPHSREFFTPEERTRMMAHAADLRAQANPVAAPATTTTQRAVTRLAIEGNATDVMKNLFSSSGQVTAGAEHMLREIQPRLSQPAWNSIRQAMWSHLLEKPEGMVGWGPRELSNRLSRFLDSPAATVLYDAKELGVMRQFQQHYDKLAPLPNTTNPSGSAVMAAKLARSMGRHVFSMLGFAGGHLTGAAIGHMADLATHKVVSERTLAKTKDMFLGKSGKGELNKNYERAGAVLAHASTPAID
jgi:hypothetical protein